MKYFSCSEDTLGIFWSIDQLKSLIYRDMQEAIVRSFELLSEYKERDIDFLSFVETC